ncbi:TonB-dependent receptor [Aliiglaciecola litoralis]|uniref:Phosphate-selective porin O and P n=1 Tax=Aliiglaciecola litoralis TaxID=582857 RepID=A0ABN1LHX4_9ALTE
MKMPPYLLVLSLLMVTKVMAGEKVNWRGFVAQGVIQAEHSNYIEDDGGVSVKLTEIGLNASYTLDTNLRVAGQVVYLNGGNRYPEGVRIDYLFLDWSAVNTLDWQVNMHLGRVKNYHWLYSSTRDVPHTRPTIVLPQSIYFDNFRDVALGVDGLAVVANTNNDFGDWEFNWSYGKSTISEEQTKNLVGQISTGDLDQRFVHQANFVWHDQKLRLGAGLLDSGFEYTQGPSDPFFDGNAEVQRLMIRAIYETESWQLAAEIFRERTMYDDLVFPGFSNDSTGEGGFVQGQYYINPELTLTARLDIFDVNRKDRDGRIREQQSGGTAPAYFGFQDQATFGVSWDFAKNWRVQAEVHRVKGTGRLAPVFIPNTVLNDRKYWSIWGLQLAHWF